MEIQITEKKENALLDRTEVQFIGLHSNEAPPTQSQVREEIAKMTNSSKEKVIIDWMRADFGKPQLRGYAKVYKSVDAAKKIERDHIIARNEKRDGKKPAEKKVKPVPAPPKEEEGGEKAEEKAEDSGEKKADEALDRCPESEDTLRQGDAPAGREDHPFGR